MAKYFNKWGYQGWGRKTYGLFQTEMTGTTAVFGRDKKIEITFNGEETFARGNVINFPNLDLSTELDDDTLTICRGFVDYHSAKVRFSDRARIDRVQSENEKTQPLLWHLFNAIESVRVEEDYTEAYPGAMKNIAEMGNEQAYSFKKKNDLAWNDKVPLEKIAPMALLCNGRKNMGYFGFNIGDIRSHVEEKDRLDEWTDRIFECGNTKEAFELAEEIYIEIMNGAKEEDDPKFNMMPSPENIIAQEIADELATSKVKDGTYPYKIYTKDNDRVHHWSDTAPTVVSEEELKNSVRRYAGAEMRKLGNISAYMKKAESLGSTINIARRRLEMMIAAQRRTEWDYTKEQGKFDSKRMTSAMAGSTDVFKTKENAADIDTAISVVIDLSGSMNNDGKRPVATDTAIVLFECLSKIGIPFEVIGFDANFSAVDKHESDRIERLFQECRSSSTAEDKRLARFEGLHTYVFKSFRDRPFDARPYIMGLSTGGVGGRNNCDGESVLLAHERLLARPEKRKIMFVLSDGHPECHCYSGEQQVTYMKKAVAQIEKKGTHIVGIGIMTDAVKSYYPKSIVVHDPKDLAGETLKVLSGLLIEKKKK